jgi:Ca2+-binding EF-hand superfamily protein
MYKHLTCFAALCFSAAALAGDDSSKTNTIETTSAEAKTAAMTGFDSLDKNHDGRISRTEAGMDKGLSNVFATADTDGDGYVSKAEYATRPKS